MDKGLLIRLRQGFYTFPEYKSKPDYPLYFANRMYRPSYINLHTALAFYGMIPEAVVQITSVTSLKTAYFHNAIGEYQGLWLIFSVSCSTGWHCLLNENSCNAVSQQRKGFL